MEKVSKKSIGTSLIVWTLAATRVDAFSQHSSTRTLQTSTPFHRALIFPSLTRLHMSSTGMDLDFGAEQGQIQSSLATTLVPEVDNAAKELQASIYRKGLITVAGITLLFASNSPAIHAAYVQVTQAPPVLLLNAATSTIALAGVFLGGPLISQSTATATPQNEQKVIVQTKDRDSPMDNILKLFVGLDNVPVRAGLELGLWKFLGTTANMYGLSQTSADHGAFLIQLTTLLVPLAQGIMGVPIPPRIWSAIAMAMGGVFLFTQDPTAGCPTTLQGDALCALAAVFYATYDLRLFKWGKLVAPLDLMKTKIATQTALSVVCLVALGGLGSAMDFFSSASTQDLTFVGLVALWSGIAVNLVAPYLQVGGQQAVGPARAQIVYASQPLWAALMSMVFLGETVGQTGMMGGAAFLGAMLLAATAEVPDPNCEQKNCEV